jgi:flagellar motor component MotA
MLDQSPRASAPPMVATKLMEWILPANIRDHLIGDLFEEFYQLQSESSTNGSPSAWFWWQSIRTLLLYIWKERGGLMAFVVSLLIFIGMTLMAMVLGGRLEMFIDWPSFLIVIPPAVAFGIAASSVQSYVSSVKLAFVDQLDVNRQEAHDAIVFLRVTGTTAVYLGFITSLIGWVAMGANIKAFEFSEVFGSAFAVSILTIMYGLMLKLICYSAEQKIQFRYLKE